MYHFIALGALLILAIIWAITRLVLLFMKQTDSVSSSPTVGSTNTDSSIAITEDYGTKKASIYNVNKQTEQSQKLLSNSSSRGKKITSNASDDSLKSRNSFGFTPSIRTVAPLANRGRRGTQNFLMLLDSLEPIENEEAKRRRQHPKKPFTTASASGIEANSSDETSSQTLIGKELDRGSDPGAIQLDYIRAQNPK
jgi:hypothetical protein